MVYAGRGTNSWRIERVRFGKGDLKVESQALPFAFLRLENQAKCVYFVFNWIDGYVRDGITLEVFEFAQQPLLSCGHCCCQPVYLPHAVDAGDSKPRGQPADYPLEGKPSSTVPPISGPLESLTQSLLFNIWLSAGVAAASFFTSITHGAHIDN